MSKGPYLKPCPFCGFTKPEEIFAMNEHWILCPQCKSSCGAQGSGITAITLWNNRPDEEKEERLERLSEGWLEKQKIGKRREYLARLGGG